MYDGRTYKSCRPMPGWFYLNASSADLKSACIALAIVEKNVDQDLLVQVDDKTRVLPSLEQGPFTTIAYVISRCGAERDRHIPALQRALEDFSFRAYHYNMTKAKKIIMTIIRALGPDWLSANLARHIFMALAAAPHAPFIQICTAKANAQFGSPNSANVISLINDTLSDFEAYYFECLGNGTWNKKFSQSSGLFSGVKKALAITDVSPPDPMLSSADRTCVQAYFSAALASARDGGKALSSFDEWVKTCKCHWCGVTGHIIPQCPKKLAGDPQLPILIRKDTSGKETRQASGQNPWFRSMVAAITSSHNNGDVTPSADDALLSTVEENVVTDDAVEEDTRAFNAFCTAMGAPPDSEYDSNESDF